MVVVLCFDPLNGYSEGRGEKFKEPAFRIGGGQGVGAWM